MARALARLASSANGKSLITSKQNVDARLDLVAVGILGDRRELAVRIRAIHEPRDRVVAWLRADRPVLSQDGRTGDSGQWRQVPGCLGQHVLGERQRRIRADLLVAATFTLAEREEVGDLRQPASHTHAVERFDLGNAVLVANHAGHVPRIAQTRAGGLLA